MVEDTRKKLVLDCCKKLAEHNLTMPGDVVSLRTDEGMLITSPDKDVASLTEEDVRFVGKNAAANATEALHLAVYGTREDINAVIMNHADRAPKFRLRIKPPTF